MGSLRPIISIYLLAVAALVALQMVFDSFYLGSADAIWGYLDWPIALAMLLALTASTRRLVLAGVGDSHARFEFVGVAFVAVVWFDAWFRKLTGGAVNLSTWLFVDALLVAAMLAVGLRLRAAGGREPQG
ncbi:MAG: hypothetical protein OXH15_15895 [Gammaproteobacteria bacterium]|nr:hypothetical protein [Gammaproteobacteria bacterium]